MDSGQKMETQMGLLLRIGVLTSCLIMFAGAVLYLLRHGEQQESFSAFHGQPPEFETLAGIWQAARQGSARGIIQLSVLVLIATPVMRVVFAVFAFGRQNQWIFCLVSLIVLALLAYGLFLDV
jgi:uncharacterized membrane protein